MIWATVSSQSCFCWLYRVSPSSAARNIINLISALTIWWCPYVVISCVVGRGCLLLPVCSLGKTLLAFALLHFVLQGHTCLLLCGSWQTEKFWKRWECQTTSHASWETCMQVKKQQLEPDTEQLVPNWERSTTRLYIVTLFIYLVCGVHYVKCLAEWRSTNWNQDCWEKYQ